MKKTQTDTTMKTRKLKLSDILENPKRYKKYDFRSTLLTYDPIRDFKRGWSYCNHYVDPKDTILESIAEGLEKDTVHEILEFLLGRDCEEYLWELSFEGEEFKFFYHNLFLRNHQYLHMHVRDLKKKASEEEYSSIEQTVYVMFTHTPGLRGVDIKCDEWRGSYFWSEYGLLSAVGYNLPESIFLLACHPEINFYEEPIKQYRYILAFQDKNVYDASIFGNPRQSDHIYAAIPDYQSGCIIIEVDVSMSNYDIAKTILKKGGLIEVTRDHDYDYIKELLENAKSCKKNQN